MIPKKHVVQMLFACVSVCACDRERDREEFQSASVIRSSPSAHIGALSRQKHRYTHMHTNTHVHPSRDLLDGVNSSSSLSLQWMHKYKW